MTTAAASTSFASPTELAAYMGVSAGELNDGQAEDALRSASAAVRAYCRWDVAAVAGGTLEVDTGDSGGPCLMLPAMNVTAVTSVVVDGWPAPVTDYTRFTAGYLRRERGWPAWRRVLVVADYGFDPVPDVCAGVAKSVASRTVATAGLGPVSQVRVDGVSTTYGKNSDVADTAVLLLPGEQAVLDMFRIPLAS